MDYSIIIPHRNSSSLLFRLLKSIPVNQHIQIIVVDDNSNKEDYDRILQYKEVIPFELYKNDGQFAGGARNTGLKHARGKWLLFADADDYFEPSLASMMRKYIDSDSDIIYFNIVSRYSNGSVAYRDEHIKKIASLAVDTNNMDYLRCCYTPPWGKLIRRALVDEKNIRFDEIVAGNDMMFSVISGLYAKTVCYESTPLYCVTVTANSITTTLTKDRFESRFLATIKVNNVLKKYKKARFQISVLYFLGKSYQFGIKYMFHVFKICIVNRSNILIGGEKLFKISKVLMDRQNTTLIQ